MNELSLFSGYGGFSLGLRLAGLDIRTVAYVEIDPYCQEILKARMRDGYLEDAPIYPDISAFNGEQCRGVVDIVTAGFPCQPHSTAGKRKGESDPRNLWPDTLRVIGEVGPGYVLLENVPGILANGYGGTVVGELSEIGYDCRWGLVSAASVGAPHLRWRWWCLGWNTKGYGGGEERGIWQGQNPIARGVGDTIPHANDDRCRPIRGATEQAGQYEALGWREQLGPDGEDGDVANAQSIRSESGCGRYRGIRSEGNNLFKPTSGSEAVADTNRAGLAQRQEQELLGEQPPLERDGGEVADTTGQPSDGSDHHGGGRPGQIPEPGDCGEEERPGGGWWATEPDVGRVAHGVAHRVDRLRALGNGVVPAVVAEFLRRVLA